MLRKMLLFFPLLFVCAIATASDKNSVYAGAELGYAGTTFVPDYATVNGVPDAVYTDRAHGLEFRMLAGYRLQISRRIALSMQGHFGFTGATWALNTTEPAQLAYKIPRTHGVSLLPSVHVARKVSLCGEIGFERGYVQEKKTSPIQSSYNYSEWTSGYAAGGGAIYDVNRRMKISLLYRHISYGSISYSSHLPDGTLWEIIKDTPTISSVNVGVSYRF
jgi:opacity protein-like surface antigen